MSSTASEPIKTRCPACGKKLGFPPAALGRKAKCPACAHVFRVTNGVAADAPAAPPAAAAANPESGNLFDALAAAEQSASLVEMSPEEAAQAQAAALAAAAAERAASAGPSATEHVQVPRLKEGRSRPEPDASFTGRDGALRAIIRGIIYCVGAVIITDAIWFGIAKAAGSPLSLFPLLVGVFAGVGMTAGMRSQSVLAGIAAVGFCIVGIIVGEGTVAVGVLLPKAIAEAQVEEEKIENQRHAVFDLEMMKADAEIEANPGQDPKAIINKAKARFGSYTDDQIRAEYKKFQAATGNAPTPRVVMTAAQIFMANSFGLGALMCSITAVVMAFFLGSGILNLGIT